MYNRILGIHDAKSVHAQPKQHTKVEEQRFNCFLQSLTSLHKEIIILNNCYIFMSIRNDMKKCGVVFLFFDLLPFMPFSFSEIRTC